MENLVQKINNASLKFLIPLEAEEMYATVVEEAKQLLNVDYGSIFIADGNKLERVYSSAVFLENIKIRNHGFTYKTFKSNEPLLLDVEKTNNFHKKFEERQIKTIVHLPLAYKNESIGVLTLHSKKSKFISEKELHILKLYGSLASLAIKKAQLYDQTRKSVEIRDMFISLASHELRTPLTSINGYIQLLHSKLGKLDTSEGKWVRELSDESKRLTSLVTELLEINRIKQGQFQFSFTETNLVEVILTSIKRLKISYPDREVHFLNLLKSNVCHVIGDPEKLLQMVTGFIDNAIKFSPATFTVEVALKENKREYLLVITDKGVGIKKSDLKHILEGFYKGSQENKEGLGVGLVLARHILQAHHGEFKMDSQVKKGTKVEIRLPKIR